MDVLCEFLSLSNSVLCALVMEETQKGLLGSWYLQQETEFNKHFPKHEEG